MEYHKKITYNPLQQLTFPHVERDCNLVVLAPTSSGKTIVAEQFIFPILNEGKKAIYLSPLKALTSEKLAEWDWLPFTKVAITGDHQGKVRPMTEKLILMTTESLDSKTRGSQTWLKDIGVLVSDESHMLAMPSRGDAFEVGLTTFAEINPSARIIFLSATIPNAKELGEWLTLLNGKPTEVIETDWRPVEQEHFLLPMPNKHWDFMDGVQDKIKKILRQHKDEQTIIFVHSVGVGRQMSKAFKTPFHYSKVPKEERYEIERQFKAKEIPTIVSTSTLAYGVNLPADIGVIVGAHRGPNEVDPSDIKQEAGRIGRYGLSEKGTVYYLFKDYHAEDMFSQVMEIPHVQSVLAARLYFHVVAMIERRKMTIPQIKTFLSKTLAGFQFNVQEKLDETINLLLRMSILKETPEIKCTPVGRAAALLYLDPIDLKVFKDGLQKLPMDPILISSAYASMPTLSYEVYTPDDVKDDRNLIQMETSNQTIIATGLNHWLSGRELTGTYAVTIPALIADIDRWTSALKIAGLAKSYTDNLEHMLKSGATEDMIELVSLRGIGRKRAKDLQKLGIRTKEDIKNNPKAKNALSEKLYQSVLSEIEGKVVLNF